MKKNEVIEIRETLDDIKRIMNESYAFGREEEQDVPDFSDDETSIETEQPLGDEKVASDVDSKDKIKQMRKIAIQLIMELDPSTDEIMYKSVKSIWDSCDKLLTKNETAVVNKNNVDNNLE